MPTLLEILSRPIPPIVCKAAEGSLTFHRDWKPVERLAVWKEFSYDNVMKLFEEVLQFDFRADIHEPSRELTSNEKDVWGEDSLKHTLSRSLVPVIPQCLAKRWDRMHPALQQAPAELVPSGFAKVSSKWTSGGVRKRNYRYPFAQVQFYCMQNHTRYGWIITDRELVVIRCSVQESSSSSGFGGAVSTPRRPRPLSYSAQILTSPSSHSDPSFASIAGYVDDGSDYEPGLLEWQSIPFDAQGPGILTVRLALWALAMLGAAEVSTTLQSQYHPLHSYTSLDEGFIHLSTGHMTFDDYDDASHVFTRNDRSVSYDNNFSSFHAEDVHHILWDESTRKWKVILLDPIAPNYTVPVQNEFWSRLRAASYSWEQMGQGEYGWVRLGRQRPLFPPLIWQSGS
ncbi:hypothetical protein BO94DRAFT_589619 [Aspergillus sclerotioniger CBS 115572]|uniref:Uncharacterized protein n=1 Tax=Aspergillus sclerotioniger CBS 115572 TaxID=1450535 RepID=A0A317VH21_9EURO|nr:hypothetical protein BO94DRAFT_589619 [Aspergillus sclerotioniger CBS 115572]PWY72467.1 hypothetical protein BO94DRAFT_589619 [Aspergillus sclerotioniger CBS 115572]